MSQLFSKPSAQPSPAPTDATEANAKAQPVEANSSTEAQQSDERRYTGTETELIVKDRLAREQKKFAKEKETLAAKIAELEKKSSTAKPVSPNVEEEYKVKLSEYEQKHQTLAEQVAKYRTQSLDSTLERALNAAGCIDPEVVMDHFKSKNLVSLDEDGNVIVDNTRNSLDDLVKDYLAKKPHLVRAQQSSGLGSKAPKSTATVLSRREELEAGLGIMPVKKSLFGR